MRLRVTHYGEPILRQAGKPVRVFDAALRKLADDMVETMHAEEGVGLAAQQIGRALMLCVVDVSALPDEDLDYELDGLRPPVGLIMPLVLANPELRLLPGAKVPGEEGCLSFPGIRGEVPRAPAVEVSYQDLAGKPHRLLCAGWFARVIQHEVDHLNGVLFIDRMLKRQVRLLEPQIDALQERTRAELSAAK